MNLVGKTLSNRYEILEQVGTGGMALVYKAKCNLLNRFVAVKVLKEEFSKDAEFVKRFRAEAQSAASLTHPNIVSVYDVGEEDGINYIVMELLTGMTLKEYIEKEGKLSSEMTLKLASQIASGLEAAHSAKIIHRDIKPQNIVLANNNIAKVTDFGIAKMSSKETITSSASTIGSVHYFSPEHAKGCYTDEKSDIYSLGVVMYEMATGELPFNADTPVTVALKQISEKPVEPKELVPSITNSLNRIILKCMEKSVADRYSSATELLDDIFAAINNREVDTASKDTFKSGGTQVVPIIGLKDDVRPSIADERPSEVISSRKASRVGKRLAEIEEEKNEKEVIKSLNEDEELKKKKKIKIIIISAVAVAVIIIGILVGKIIASVNESNKPKIQVEAVPYLLNKNFEEMKAKYEVLGLNIVASKYEENAEVEAGNIISQSIAANTPITTNSISVVVSKGVKKITMIDVENKDYTVAKYELEAIGFEVEIEQEKNEDVEKNLVVSQSIEPDEEVVVGTKVTLVVSKGDGKVKVIMPSVIGNTEAKAKATLQNLKFTVNVSYVNDTSKSDGVVITQSIKENSEVEEKSVVTLTVNRLEKTKDVTIKLSEYTKDVLETSVDVKVTAQVEGVTNTIHTSAHTKGEEEGATFEDFTVQVNGFSSAKLIVYVNEKEVDQITIAF